MINKVIQWFRDHFGIVLIFFIGVVFIFCSSKMNEHLLNQNYIFEFELQSEYSPEPTHLYDFIFHYDFTKNKGNISIHIRDKVFIKYLRIKFPVAIDNTTLKTCISKNGDCIHFNPNISTDVLVYYFEKEFSDETLVIDELKFKPNLEPNGWFRFQNYGSILHSNTHGNIQFVFGDNYECVQGCIHDPEGIEVVPYSSFRDLRFKFTNGLNQSESSFKISSINRRVLFLKNLFLALGVALLVSSMMVLLQERKVYSQKRDDKDKFQEFSQGFLDIIKEKDGIGEKTLNKIKKAWFEYKEKKEQGK
ncbi:MAG: hypothetical protein U9Q92_04930 [archaeon]|nr:hypothetical protein [archaeon]